MPVSKNRRKSKKSQSQKQKRSRLIMTVALYGPNDTVATKMVASVVNENSGDIKEMEKWFSNDAEDVREIDQVVRGLAGMVEKWNLSTIVAPDKIIGCPHEEGIDYEEGASCPKCPYWAGRDRFTGALLQ